MKVNIDKPMMADKEVEIIDKMMVESAPAYCLEFGSGGSTKYFPKHHTVELWLSIEHNGHFVQALSGELQSNTVLIWVDNEWYIDSVKHGRKFDMILVDGQEREKCLQHAFELLNPGGFILLHDAGRADLYPLIKKYDGELLIDGEEPLGDRFKHRGLAVFR